MEGHSNPRWWRRRSRVGAGLNWPCWRRRPHDDERVQRQEQRRLALRPLQELQQRWAGRAGRLARAADLLQQGRRPAPRDSAKPMREWVSGGGRPAANTTALHGRAANAATPSKTSFRPAQQAAKPCWREQGGGRRHRRCFGGAREGTDAAAAGRRRRQKICFELEKPVGGRVIGPAEAGGGRWRHRSAGPGRHDRIRDGPVGPSSSFRPPASARPNSPSLAAAAVR